MVLESQASGELTFKNLIKNTSGLLSFSMSLKNVKINFQCTLAHIPGSLKNLCTDFNVPETITKDSLDIQNVTKDTYNTDLKDKIIYYLQNDVLSLANIWMKHVQSLLSITDPCNCQNSRSAKICTCLDEPSLLKESFTLDI